YRSCSAGVTPGPEFAKEHTAISAPSRCSRICGKYTSLSWSDGPEPGCMSTVATALFGGSQRLPAKETPLLPTTSSRAVTQQLESTRGGGGRNLPCSPGVAAAGNSARSQGSRSEERRVGKEGRARW